MKEDINRESPVHASTGFEAIWRYLSIKRKLLRMQTVRTISISIVILTSLVMLVVVFYVNGLFEGNSEIIFTFPDEWNYAKETIKWIDGVVDWLVINLDHFFSVINTIVLRYLLIPLEHFFLSFPWWVIIILTGLIGWWSVSLRFALLAMGFIVAMCLVGLLDLSSTTLAITLASTLLSVMIGLPLGILAAKSNMVDKALSPILDVMQTMPCFVYLIPALMLFGLGKIPAVVATVIYAIPPLIRLTNLGVRQVAPSLIEASQAFGATTWQLLVKVQIPLALPAILTGLNQTVMMALSMVVMAAMIGAKGLGVEVLNGIARLEVGRGVIAGISVVFMAIIMDRVSRGYIKKMASIAGIVDQS